MMRLLWSSKGKVLEIDESADKLAEGGEGRVFRVPGHADLVAKVFRNPSPRQEKIRLMLCNPPSDKATPGHVSIAWPVGALMDASASSAFAGYLMKKIEKASPFHEISQPKKRIKERPHFTFGYLLIIASNVRALSAHSTTKGT